MRSFRTLLLASTLFVLGAVTASAQATMVACKDGTKSKGGQGACSSHGGVAPAAAAKAAKADKKADKKADAMADKGATKAAKAGDKAADKSDAKAAKPAAKDDKDATGATAECKDGTFSHSKTHQGSCSRHGGVAKFLDGKK